MNRDRHRKRPIKGAISSGFKARSLSIYRVQRRRKMNTVLMRINGHTHIVDVPRAGRSGCICSSVRVRPSIRPAKA